MIKDSLATQKYLDLQINLLNYNYIDLQMSAGIIMAVSHVDCIVIYFAKY